MTEALPEEGDGELAPHHSAAADISTCAEGIIKNTTDPSWRNNARLLPHLRMLRVGRGGGSGANSLLALSRNQEAVTPNPCGRRRPRQDLSGE